MIRRLTLVATVALGAASLWLGAGMLLDEGVRVDAGGAPGISSAIGIFAVSVGTVSITGSLMALAWGFGTAIANRRERHRRNAFDTPHDERRRLVGRLQKRESGR